MSHKAHDYVKWLTNAPNGDKLTPAQKLVLHQLADDHNEDRGYAFPSVATIAARCGMEERYVRKLLGQLRTNGVLESQPFVRDNGGHTSNRYRFTAIDAPFSAKEFADANKRLRLQASVRANRAVQLKLDPPVLGDRGPLSSETRGGGLAGQGGTVLGDRGGLSWETPPEPLTEPKGLTSVEPASDPLNNSLPSSAKRARTLPVDDEKFQGLQLELKSELLSIPERLKKAKGFTVIPPSPGATPVSTDNDYDVCFRDWWLYEVVRRQDVIMLVTIADDTVATVAGLDKYQSRISRLAQKYFGNARQVPIQVRVCEAARSSGA